MKRRRYRGQVWPVMLLAYLPCSQALQVDDVQIRFHEGAYQLTMTATLAAPAERVEAVLRDYERYPQLDARILTAQVVARTGPNQLELLTRINVCYAFLCRKVERVEQVDEKPGELLATVIAQRSDAERGHTHTQWRAMNDHTQVTYTTEIVPKFRVLGRSMMLRRMRDATINLFTNIERAAQAPAA